MGRPISPDIVPPGSELATRWNTVIMVTPIKIDGGTVMGASLFDIQTPEEVCEAVWDSCPNECNKFVQMVADGLRMLAPTSGTADNITWLISNWPTIESTITMLSTDYIRAVTYALRGDFVIAGATADEISNSVNSNGRRHNRTSHGHVAVITGSDGKGNAVAYSKAHGGTPHRKAKLSQQFPASLIRNLHYFVVLRGNTRYQGPFDTTLYFL